ncbi:MAG: molybdopterin-dependent oxidoreductase [Betaproteobacteria bacterium]|nr:molybdopterin-dependent oxidoreductase [Betaproteobacteria bacterium]
MLTSHRSSVAQGKDAQQASKVVGICGICPGGCGVEIELVGGRIERLKPLKGHPAGIVCPRGAKAKEIVYSPDRLKHPLVRVSEKGEGRFERIAWDAALDRIAERLLEIKRTTGPEAVMTYIGRGLFDKGLFEAFAPPGVTNVSSKSLIFPFGSPNNAGCGSVCQTAYGVLAALSTFGFAMEATYPDFGNARLIVIWGANPATDSPPSAVRKILAAKRKGARLVAIDPMRSHAAANAHQWIPVRSGTDGALALGMINVIIAERLYDREFVEKWTLGFDELRDYAARFTPKEVERITRVPANVVVETARLIATAKPAALSMYTGLEYTSSGVQNLRAVFVLFAITGNLDVPGGIMLRAKRKAPYRRTNIAPPPDVKPIGYDRYPLFCEVTKAAQFMEAPRAILKGDPYPVKALIIAGASIITGYPNPDLWKRCFSALDLLVVTDRFMTADAQYADFVLPATTYFENKGYQKYPGYLQLRERVIEPLGEARSDYWIFMELARRLGYGDVFPADEDALAEYVLRDHPVGIEELRRHPEGVRFGKPEEQRKYEKGLLREDRQPGFPTPSGKLEIASSLLEKYGFDALPKYTEPSEGPLADPELARDYPLVLNTGARLQSAYRSQHLNIPGLLAMQPEPQVLIHPVDALARAIAEGDLVQVRTKRGSVPFRARVTDGIIAGGVEVNAGGGGPIQAEAWRRANVNYLTDCENRDPISGFPVYKALLCEVEKLPLDAE